MNSQAHGFAFEDMVKASSYFSGASNFKRSHTEDFDIEARFDKRLGIPTSVKTTKSKSIALADARRFWRCSSDFRLVVGVYTQNGEVKDFSKVYEFTITQAIHSEIVGSVSLEFVEKFHEIISTKSLQDYQTARNVAKALNDLRPKSLISLNPKIDSKTQRRLQCSISIDTLKGIAEYSEYEQSYANLMLPLRLKSPSRNAP